MYRGWAFMMARQVQSGLLQAALRAIRASRGTSS
jgi:hypothetical protein